MNRNILLYATSLCLMIAIFGCASAQHSPEKISMQSLEKNAIVIGTGGGFSGLYTGYVLSHSGDVYSWRNTKGTPDTLKFEFHAAADSLNFFFRYLDEIGFNDLSLHSSGNMTSDIERITPDSVHRIQWALDASGSAPPEISAFYLLVSSYARRHLPKP